MLPSAVHLLPTPAVNDMGAAYTPDEWDAWCAAQKAKHGNGNGHGKSLEIEAARLIPTPTVRDWRDGGDTGANVEEKAYLGRAVWNRETWGQYAEAIQRWEALTRVAPEPTELNKLGNRRLSPRFSEWLMGLPDGWITDVPDITRNEALKLCGNGVVPQQAAAAVRSAMQTILARAVAA